MSLSVGLGAIIKEEVRLGSAEVPKAVEVVINEPNFLPGKQ